MVSAFVNIFKIPDLRQRILYTLAMIVIVRIGYAITLPGVNPHVLQALAHQGRQHRSWREAK